MKYAITYENHQVFQHFGKTPSFLLVEIANDKVTQNIVSTEGKGHGAIVDFLVEHHVDTLVCGGIGQGARDALTKKGITLLSGASGNIDDVVDKVLKGILKDDPSGMCNHHHEENGHDCGSHSCGDK